MSPQYTELWKLYTDVYILGQFHTYLQFRGRKYLNTFIVTNANNCPNILSHGAIFRMGILVPNYLEENMVKLGDKETGTSNVFQVFQDLRMKQYQGNSEPKVNRPSTTFMTNTTRQPKVSKTHETASQKADTANMSQNLTPCRTMLPPKTSACGTIPTSEFKVNTRFNTTHSTIRPASETHQLYSHIEPPTCGYMYIYIREHHSEQAQHTHTPKESSTELPATGDGKFQHGGTSRLQPQC